MPEVKEKLYVVAYRSYDEHGNRIHIQQCFAKGPFAEKKDAFEYAKKTCEESVIAYQSFCNCEMSINGDDVTMYRINGDEKRKVITLTVVELEYSYNPYSSSDCSIFESSTKKKKRVCRSLLAKVLPED